MASMTLMSLSLHAAQAENDPERARAWVEDGLELLEPGPTVGHLILVANLSTLVQAAGDVRRAADLRRQSLLLHRRAQSLRLNVTSLGSASEWALERGQATLAARLLGASLALEDRIGATPEWFNVTFIENHTEAVRTALGEDAFAVALKEGRGLEHDEAIDEALRLYEEIADAPPA